MSCPLPTKDYQLLEQVVGVEKAYSYFMANGAQTPEIRTFNGRPSQVFATVEQHMGTAYAVKARAFMHTEEYRTIEPTLLKDTNGEPVMVFASPDPEFGLAFDPKSAFGLVLGSAPAKTGTVPTFLRAKQVVEFDSRKAFLDHVKQLRGSVAASSQDQAVVARSLRSQGVFRIADTWYADPKRLERFDSQMNFVPFTRRGIFDVMEDDSAEQITAKLTGEIHTPTPSRINLEQLHKPEAVMGRVAKAMGVEVRASTGLGANAEVFLEDGKLVIALDPDRYTDGIMAHELGHILIDGIGGLSNPMVAQGVRQVQATALWAETLAAYPDKSPEVQQKEALAEAIGRRAEEFITEEGALRRWKLWLELFFNRIKSVFGFERDQVLALTGQLLTRSYPRLDLSGFSERYQSRFKPRIDKLHQQELAFQDSYKDAISRIDDQIRVLQNQQTSRAQRANLQQMKALKENLQILLADATIDPAKATQVLLDAAIGKKGQLTMAHAEIAKHAEPDAAPLSLSALNRLSNLLGVFDIEDVIESQISQMPDSNPYKQTFRAGLSELVSIRKEITQFWLSASKESVAHALMEFQTRAEKDYADNTAARLRAEHKDWTDAQIYDEVQRLMLENEEMLQNQKFKDIISSLEHLSDDLSKIGMNLYAVKNSADRILPLVADMIDTYRTQASWRTQEWVWVHNKALKKLQAHRNNASDPKVLYAQILEQTPSGAYTGNLVGRYTQEFYDLMEKAMRDAHQVLGQGQAAYAAQLDAFKLDYMVPMTEEEKKEAWDKLVNDFGEAKAKEIQILDHFYGWKPNPVFESKQYAELMALPPDNPVREYWTLITENRAKTSTYIPAVLRNNQRLPFARRTLVENFNMGNTVKGIGQAVKNQVQRKEDDTDVVFVREDASGKQVYNLPVFYGRPENYDVNEQSFDVATLMDMEHANRMTYHSLNKIVPVLGQLELLLDKTVVQKKLSGKLAFRRQTDSTEVEATKKPGRNNRADAFRAMIEDQVYGITMSSDDFMPIDPKHLRLAMSYTSTVMLGLNVLAGAANVTMGNVLLAAEAVGGEYFTAKNLLRAEKEYAADLPAIMGDIGRDRPKSFINLLGEIFDPINDNGQKLFVYSENTLAKRLLKTHHLQAFNASGEHYMANVSMLAALNKIKVRNAEGKFITAPGAATDVEAEGKSLLDAYKEAYEARKSDDNPGMLRLPDYVSSIQVGNQTLRLPKLSGKETAKEADQAVFDRERSLIRIRHRIQQLNEDLFGAYGLNNKMGMQRYSAGLAASMFRKWIVPGMMRRFMGFGDLVKSTTFKKTLNAGYEEIGPRWSQFSEEYREGIYTTTLRFIRDAWWNIKGAKAQSLIESELAEATPSLSEMWKNRTALQRANMRRAGMEIAAATAAATAAVILRGLAEDAPDDEEPYWYMAAFVSRRLQSELMFYYSVPEMINIISSPAATLSMAEEVVEAAWMLVTDPLDLELKRYESGRRSGDLRLAKEWMDVVPLAKQVDAFWNAKERLGYYN